MLSSFSGTNFTDLISVSDDFPMSTPTRIPKFITTSNFDDQSNHHSPSIVPSRRIVVSNHLPIISRPDPDDPTQFIFSWDHDVVVFQLKSGYSESNPTEIVYVGTLKNATVVDVNRQEQIAQRLYQKFRCVPVFLNTDVHNRFYHGFCKHYLWPLLHYMLPLGTDGGGLFDRKMWRSYVSVNIAFAEKVMEVIDPDDDYVLIHDYHLFLLPTFLRKRFYRMKIGFFLHSPFPSSEIYRTIPVRDEILRGLLNCDLVGFHTFDYARHFLACCGRMLGLVYQSKRGYIGLEYYGRTVTVKILPVGIDMGEIESVMSSEETREKLGELMEEFVGKTVLLGVDDMDLFKGISLKIKAMGQLLEERPELIGKVVLVQITNPARSVGNDVQAVQNEIQSVASTINDRYGALGYDPIVLINRPMSTQQKAAYYAVSECCIVNAVRDGMNLVPYNYTVCRQGTPATEPAPKKSVIVVSEFIGCSPSLSGAIRVNPWNIDAVAEAMSSAITMPEEEKQLRHEKHYKYVSSHNVGYWARSFDLDLQRACRDHYQKRCWGIGFGLGFRIVALGPNFRKLSVEHLVAAYRRTTNRLILLDYDGTLIPHSSIDKKPSKDMILILNSLCNDMKNLIFIISGRGRDHLDQWLGSVDKLGISAEHGYFRRWTHDSQWETCSLSADFKWKAVVEPIMRHYTEATDGSNIENKETAMVWHHQEADPDFGSWQAKELFDHLESVLTNQPVVVKKGKQIVEVKPQGMSKGIVVDDLITHMMRSGKPPDFVLCIGDDCSDEDMFENISCSARAKSLLANAEVFACTVGNKPSKAKYYLDDTMDVIKMLQSLVNASIQQLPRSHHPLPVLFERSA